MGFEDDPRDELEQYPCECGGDIEHTDIGICPKCFNEACVADCPECGVEMCFWRCDNCDVIK